MSAPFTQTCAAVVHNIPLARSTYRLRLHAPGLAAAIRPGQFVMLRLPGRTDPLLGRPFALYDVVPDADGQPGAVDIVYLVVGKLTGLLAALRPGDAVEVWGPLGNGFPDVDGVEHVGLVAGGIGQTPFLAHVRELLGAPATAAGRRDGSAIACRSTTVCAAPSWRRASRTFGKRAQPCIWRRTMAAPASTAL